MDRWLVSKHRVLQAIKGFQKILDARPYETETAKTLARLHFRIKVPLFAASAPGCSVFSPEPC